MSNPVSHKKYVLFHLKNATYIGLQIVFFIIAWQGVSGRNLQEVLFGVSMMIYFLMREKAVKNG